MLHKLTPLAAGLLLAGCVAVPDASAPVPPPAPRPPQQQPVPPARPAPPSAGVYRVPEIMQVPGLEPVIQQDADTLLRLFGAPRLDVREGDMRKLQFAGEACVLDIFLYPLRPGAQQAATWVQARRASDGAPVDRAACLQALRRGGRR